MATENIVSKVYRVLTDVSSRVWDKISFWCLAKDVELANGKNLETTCGSITGITSSLTSTSTTMAASASAIKQLNDKIADLNSNLSNLDFGDFITYSKTTEISKIQLSAMEVGKWYEMVIYTSKTEGELLDSVGCEDVTHIRIVPSYAGRSLFLVNFKATAETVEININGIGQVSYILRKLT